MVMRLFWMVSCWGWGGKRCRFLCFGVLRVFLNLYIYEPFLGATDPLRSRFRG